MNNSDHEKKGEMNKYENRLIGEMNQVKYGAGNRLIEEWILWAVFCALSLRQHRNGSRMCT
jgi:hypothetical protein